MSSNGPEDPTYNPFAEYDHDSSTMGPTIAPQGFYSSAFFPEHQAAAATTALRIRRPGPLSFGDAEQGPYKWDLQKRKAHLRASSETQVVPPSSSSSSSAGLHPLKSALAATVGFSEGTHVTRPNLSRVVSEANPLDASASDNPGSTSRSVSTYDDERDVNVIVHPVTSKDSLAGVALKYGITLASLRRSNQLWTSDSIHRRSVLYIPIDQATRAHEYIQEPRLISLTPDASEESTDVFADACSATTRHDDDDHSTSSHPPVPVARVPAKQLTYFPPSSNNKRTTKRQQQTTTTPSRLWGSGTTTTTRISPTSSRYDPSLPNNSLTSILTALPIAASTRDEIITRLSFDGSVSSSYTDRSRTSSNEDIGHELDEVVSRKSQATTRSSNSSKFDDIKFKHTALRLHSHHANDMIDEASIPTPRPGGGGGRPLQNPLIPLYHQSLRLKNPDGLKKSTLSSSSSSSSLFHPRSLSSTSPPRFYVSQPHQAAYVRTSQLEPSPAMEIPIRRCNGGSAVVAADHSRLGASKKVGVSERVVGGGGHAVVEKTRRDNRTFHSESLPQRTQVER